VPHKGFYTQGLAILLRQGVAIKAIEKQLRDFKVVKKAAESSIHWLGGPTLVVEYRPEVNGYAAIDIVDQPWPDHMGDPKGEPELFGAWAMGHFGPGAWPGSLERACQHSWSWADGRTVPLEHRAFIRIRMSYVFGTERDVPIMPADYEPLGELEFATRLAAALVGLPETLCYFNPNGERVIGAADLLESLDFHASAKQKPLDVWSNVRFFTFSDLEPAWSHMDTVGMGQLDAPDHEALFQSDAYEPGQVDVFLRNASAYVAERGPVVQDGDTMDGPGAVRWRATNLEESRIAPPRPVIRWLPEDGRQAPPK
jgi:hypothetical protein